VVSGRAYFVAAGGVFAGGAACVPAATFFLK
jgi:hypothetical protein